MATPEENLQRALDRAAERAERGDSAGAARWEASAERYRGIIDAKNRIEIARQNVLEIQKRFQGVENFPAVPILPPETTPEPPTIPQPVTPIAPRPYVPTYTNYEPDPAPKRVDPVPATPPPTTTVPVAVAPPPPPVKTAPIDTVLYDEEAMPIEIMADLIFENIGGQELINIARTDTVNGQPVVYQPIKNLTQIQQQYNPNNIVALQATSDKYFQNFSIKLDNKVPEVGNGPGGSNVYIDPQTGDLVIEAINLQTDEQIEVEITTSGTIYEVEL